MAALTKNPDDLSEQARRRLGIYFVKEFEVEPDKLLAMTLNPNSSKLSSVELKGVNLMWA